MQEVLGIKPVGEIGAGGSFRCFIPFSFKGDNNDQHIVEGYASTEAVDSEGEVIKLDALHGALPDYMKFGNIREMHQLKAVGKVKDSNVDSKGLFIQGKVVDKDAWEKVKEGVLSGFSIGGRATARDPTNRKIITGLDLIEISLVDRPSNPEAIIDLYRATDAKEQNTMTVDPTPSRAPGQVWDCGIPGHHHSGKDSALKCITEQDDTFGKGADAVALRQSLADAIAELDPEQLVKAANDLAKRKSQASDGPDSDERTDPADPPPPGSKDQPGRTKKAEPDASEKEPKSSETVGTFTAQDPPQTQDWEGKGKKPPQDNQDDPDNDGDAAGDTDDDGDGPPAKKAEEVVYADPGHLADKKARYPLSDAAQIRAAHALLAKTVNQQGYSAPQLEQMQARIVGAAQASGIDLGKAAGAAQSGFGAPDARQNVKKGLVTAVAAIQLQRTLDTIVGSIAHLPDVAKGDVPTRFPVICSEMAKAVKGLVDEEVAEILGDAEFGKADAPLAYADHALALAKQYGTGEAIANTLYTTLRDHTDKPGVLSLSAVAEKIAKVGSESVGTFSAGKPPQTQDWGSHGAQPETDYNRGWSGKVQKMHDDLVAMGATCSETQKSPKKGGEAFKSADPGTDLVDAITKRDGDDKANKILKLLADMRGDIDEVRGVVVKQRRDPAPPPRLRVVDKADDVSGRSEDDTKNAIPDPQKDPEGHRKALFAEIQRNPRIFTTGGGRP